MSVRFAFPSRRSIYQACEILNPHETFDPGVLGRQIRQPLC